METTAPRPTGLVHAFRAFSVKLVGAVQERVELFALELHEEKVRLIQTFIWVSAAVFSGMMAVTFASLTLVYLFWEDARLLVFGGLTLFYLGALVALGCSLRRFLARQPSPFAATLQAFSDDRACIGNAS